MKKSPDHPFDLTAIAFDGSRVPLYQYLPCGNRATFDSDSGISYRCDQCWAVVGSIGQPEECKQEAKKYDVLKALGGNAVAIFSSHRSKLVTNRRRRESLGERFVIDERNVEDAHAIGPARRIEVFAAWLDRQDLRRSVRLLDSVADVAPDFESAAIGREPVFSGRDILHHQRLIERAVLERGRDEPVAARHRP